MKQTLTLAFPLVLALCSQSALAADGHAFLRGEAGNSTIDVAGTSEDDTALALRGGYWFNDNFALEAFYTSLGDDSSGGVSAELAGIGAGLVAKHNFGPDHTGFFVDTRFGFMRTKTDISVAGLGRSVEDEVNPYIGLGLGYDFNERFGLALNYGLTRVSSARFRTLTAGAEFRF